MNEQETIDDIIAEKRLRAAEMEKTLGDQHSFVESLKNDADRLEAALGRERGDFAALREALICVLRWLKRMNAEPLNTLAVSELTPSYAVNRTAKSIIEDNDYHISQLTAALAAPPRNCDRYSHDEALQVWASEKGNGHNGCFDEWLYEAAKEGAAK